MTLAFLFKRYDLKIFDVSDNPTDPIIIQAPEPKNFVITET